VVKVHSWGRLGSFDHQLRSLSDRSDVASQLQHAATGQGAGSGVALVDSSGHSSADSVGEGRTDGLAYGMGRSYGDVCLNPGGVLWNTTALDRFIRFDETTGQLRCEAGILLRDVQRLVVPRGWMLPVVPGTQLATIGGAVANDVHGKNHHVAGSFGDHVLEIVLARTDGSVSVLHPGDARFAATVGGLGLTGVITEVTLQLKRIQGPWLAVETQPYENLEAFFDLADSSEADWEHTVSWIDCVSGLGRGIFMRANHSEVQQQVPSLSRQLRMPFVPPVSLVNKLTLKPFNQLYYQLKKKRTTTLQHYESFFHPLDNLLDWNRMYGPRGFFQYQCVLPRERGREGVQAMLAQITRSGAGSFLAVLKTFGERPSVGMLSFARPGVTLALDFTNQGEKTLALFASLDNIVRDADGRLYPAKDARMPRDLFEAGYPRLQEFLSHRDPGISSAMSRRLMGS
jgi:FAD/FMN-containing dehydrogenase